MLSEEDGGIRTGNTTDSLFSRQIGDVHKGVIERRKDVCDAENQLALSDLGAE